MEYRRLCVQWNFLVDPFDPELLLRFYPTLMGNELSTTCSSADAKRDECVEMGE